MLVGAIAGSLLGGFSGMEMLIIASLGVCGVMMFKTENRLLLAVPPRLGARGGDVRPQLLALHQRLYAGQRHGAVRQLRRRVTLRRHDGLRKTFGGGLIVSALLALMS